jgi:crotonobetainyl-CoA:carnitine CoA-transferase CaiB-like acyl-CoA transferase
MVMALEGIKVIDCSQVAAVPMAARHLGDFGADVIHVEHPVFGDFWRGFQEAQTDSGGGACPSDFNYNWEQFNRNKRSITVNLYNENGRAIMYKMVAQADVFLSNLRPFELERFKMDYETLSKINPRLIWGNITGYGKTGPDKDHPAYDTTAYWARSGIHSLFSVPGVPVMTYRPAFGDTVAGLALAYGIVQALYVREKTGLGQAVDVSLLHTGLYQLSFDVSGALITGKDVKDWREEPPLEMQQQSLAAIAQIGDFYAARTKSPLTGMYPTKDMRSLLFVVLQPDRYWEKFCKAVGREDFSKNPKYDTMEGRAEDVVALRKAFAEIFVTKTLEEWIPLLEGIPYAPNQTLLEAVKDIQVRENGYLVSYEHPERGVIEQLANPVMMSKTPASVRMPAPEFGQHTEEVLLEYGYTWDDIALFQEDGTIA